MKSPEDKIAYWTEKMYSLRMAPISAGRKWPHKALLLLSLIDLVEEVYRESNKIFIDDRLINKFNNHWQSLAPDLLSTGDIRMPLIRLQNEGFWTLNEGNIDSKADKQISSLKSLLQITNFGYLNEEFYTLLQDNNTRIIFRENLIEFYFGFQNYGNYSFQFDNDELLQTTAEKIYKNIPPEPIEIYKRRPVFKQVVKEQYNYQCCISGFGVQKNLSINEACHIVDHARTGNDSIANGICFNPLVHRAFDNGFFTIDENYKVVVSEYLGEVKSPHNLTQFNNKMISLPSDPKYYPWQEFLEFHRRNKFEKFLK